METTELSAGAITIGDVERILAEKLESVKLEIYNANMEHAGVMTSSTGGPDDLDSARNESDRELKMRIFRQNQRNRSNMVRAIEAVLSEIDSSKDGHIYCNRCSEELSLHNLISQPRLLCQDCFSELFLK